MLLEILVPIFDIASIKKVRFTLHVIIFFSLFRGVYEIIQYCSGNKLLAGSVVCFTS